MPFKSEKQRRYLWANEPEIARDWSDKYGSRVKKQEGGGFTATWLPNISRPINLDPYIYPEAHEEKYDTRKEWATSPQMYHNEIMNDYVTNVSKNLSELPYIGNFLAAGAELGVPVASGILSLPYDLKQAVDDWQTQEYSSVGDAFKGLFFPGGTIDHQNPLSSLYHRTKGSLRPLGRRLENIGRYKMHRDKRATQQGKAQVEMQRRIREAERQRVATNQVRQNIRTYGNRDRPNTGINRPGGERGRSPTGGDVVGTPFNQGGLVSLWPR